MFKINQNRISHSEKFDKLIINDSLYSKNVLHYFEEQDIASLDDDSTFFLKLICLENSAFSSSSYFASQFNLYSEPLFDESTLENIHVRAVITS